MQQSRDDSRFVPAPDPSGPSAALVRAAARGDADAYRSLMMRYADRVYGFSTRLLSDPAEAEDVTQESFTRLWRALLVNPPKGPVPAWLFRTARNLCIDRLRRKGRVVTEAPDGTADGVDADPNPEELRVRVDAQDAVAAAMNGLPERQRAAIALVHYDEMSGRDAAQVMGVSEEALESLLARGRRGLRKALASMKEDL